MKKIISVVTALLMITACGQEAQNPQQEALEKIDQICAELFPADEPGAAVLIMQDDSIIFDKGYGIADINTKVPIDGNTFFNIASVSKQFTATSVLQLMEEGKLSLEDSVAAYYPEYTNPIWKEIKIKHLLAHSSGIPDSRSKLLHLTREQRILGDDSLAIAYFPLLENLNFQPGTQYEYMNPTFVLCGNLIERVSGQPFEEYVAEHVFRPAGMEHTLYFRPEIESQIPNMAHGYEYEDVENMPEERTATTVKTDEPKNWYELDYGEETFFATRPDGGIYTSTHEFANWERALRANTVMKAETRELAQSPKTLITGSEFSDYQNRENTWYGYGWFIEPKTDTSNLVIYHTGDNGGFKILAARYPESNALVLIFSNRADWDRYELMQQFEAALGY